MDLLRSAQPTNAAGGVRRSGADLPWIAGLFAVAIWIWTSGPAGVTGWADTLPVAAALPLFVWFGAPWPSRPRPEPVSLAWLAVAVAVFVIGLVSGLMSFRVAGWLIALAAWLRSRTPEEALRARRGLWILPAMAFPWLAADLPRLGWWFRLSAAAATGSGYAGLGFHVARDGTHLVVQGAPVAVDASCAGLNTLQAMLVAGAMVGHMILGARAAWWWLIPMLVGLAWLANVIRVMMLTAAALSFGPEFAMGWFHQWGGWSVLLIMFLVAWASFRVIRSAVTPTPAVT